MKLKTLKDLIGKIDNSNLPYVETNKIRREIIKWIKLIKQKDKEHWKKLNKYGFVDFPETETENAYFFQLEDMHFESWHEASDVDGAIMILEHIFNIKEKDLK